MRNLDIIEDRQGLDTGLRNVLLPEELASQMDPEYNKSTNKRTAEDQGKQVVMRRKLNLFEH